MKNKLSVLAVVLSVVALGAAYLPNRSGVSQAQTKESAYDRVMRTKTLRCGYSLWPTETEMDPVTKKMSGLVPDFAEELAKKLGLKIEWTLEFQWGQQMEALRSGKIDALCSSDGPWVTSSAAFVDYVEPMFYVPIYLYGRAGETRFKTMEDANSSAVTFSTMDGDTSLPLALEKFPKAHRIELSQGADQSLVVTNVITGKADLVLMSPQTVEAVNKTSNIKLEKIFPDPVVIISSSFSVPKGEQELLQLLSQGFRILHQFGISDKILNRIDPEKKLILRVAKPYQK